MGLNTIIWGPKFWLLMHSMADFFDSVNSENGYQFFRYIKQVLPCKECREHFGKFTIPRSNFTKWLVKVHNDVNRRLGKSIYSKKVLVLDTDSKEFNKLLIECAYYANYSRRQTRLTKAFIPFVLALIASKKGYSGKYLQEDALVNIYQYSKTTKSFEQVMEKLEKAKIKDCKQIKKEEIEASCTVSQKN